MLKHNGFYGEKKRWRRFFFFCCLLYRVRPVFISLSTRLGGWEIDWMAPTGFIFIHGQEREGGKTRTRNVSLSFCMLCACHRVSTFVVDFPPPSNFGVCNDRKKSLCDSGLSFWLYLNNKSSSSAFVGRGDRNFLAVPFSPGWPCQYAGHQIAWPRDIWAALILFYVFSFSDWGSSSLLLVQHLRQLLRKAIIMPSSYSSLIERELGDFFFSLFILWLCDFSLLPLSIGWLGVFYFYFFFVIVVVEQNLEPMGI